MNEKKKPGNNTLAKIVFTVTGIIILAFVLSVGSCIYRLVKSPQTAEIIRNINATDAEIAGYKGYLNYNVDAKREIVRKYEAIIPQEVKDMKFDSHAEAARKYFELRDSKDRSSLSQKEQELGKAYQAYGDYYAAIAIRVQFTNIMKSSDGAKAAAKAMMNSDAEYQRLKRQQNASLK
jgi:hypothetical protein